METPSEKQYLDQHLNLHGSILSELKKIDDLKHSDKRSQQDKYMKTFMIVLDKIHKELEEAQKSYDVNDVQRKKAQVCSQLNQELRMHKKRCLELHDQVRKGKGILQKEKNTFNSLNYDHSALVVALRRKSRERETLRARARHLSSSPLFMQKHKNNNPSNCSTRLFFLEKYQQLPSRNSNEMRGLLTQVDFRQNGIRMNSIQETHHINQRTPSSSRQSRKKSNFTIFQRQQQESNSLISQKMALQPRAVTRIRKPYMNFRNPESRQPNQTKR